MENYLKNVIDFAIKKASLETKSKDIPVCAVIFSSKTKEIISYATNQTEKDFDPTAHAEMLAIKKASQTLKQTRLNNYEMFVTLEPCPMCAVAISFARLKRLYFGAYNVKAGGVEHGCRIYQTAPHLYQPEVYGGFEETKCSALLTTFFKTLRDEKI